MSPEEWGDMTIIMHLYFCMSPEVVLQSVLQLWNGMLQLWKMPGSQYRRTCPLAALEKSSITTLVCLWRSM